MAKTLGVLVVGVVTVMAAGGCGGGLGSVSPVPPERYQPLRPQAGNAMLIELPGQTGFMIHDKSSQQLPGQDGKARSSADAEPAGTAFCTTEVADGGTATSGFTLGAALNNDSGSALPVAVTCDVEYEYAVKISAASGGRKTAGQLSFTMEAREEGTGKVLCQHPLASLSGFEDNLKRTDQQRLQFIATISPQTRWQVVLQGKVDAQSSSDGQADLKLRVTRCRMVVKEQSAPASQPKDHTPEM